MIKMTKNNSENKITESNPSTGVPLVFNSNVCDLNYLTELMGNKNHLIIGIMDAFLMQVPEELKCIGDAIAKTDYAIIRSFAHTMKSSVSIMGISILTPILKEMEDLGSSGQG